MSPKTKSIPNPYARKIIVAFKVNADEMKRLLAEAQRFTGGNVSLLVRERALKLKPAKKRGKP